MHENARLANRMSNHFIGTGTLLSHKVYNIEAVFVGTHMCSLILPTMFDSDTYKLKTVFCEICGHLNHCN